MEGQAGRRRAARPDSTDPAAVRAWLAAHAEEPFRRFSASLLPGTENLLGVRLPLLRRLAAEIAKGDWRGYLSAAADVQDPAFEETMLRGMVIGCAPMPMGERLAHTAAFVPAIDNWSVCDSFCAGWKAAGEDREAVAAFLTPYWTSAREFDVRFAVVMRLFYYIDEEALEETLALLAGVSHPGYYARMAVAWAASLCYAAFPERTEAYLRGGALRGETYRKTLQKILESRQVGPEAKARIRALRRAAVQEKAGSADDGENRDNRDNRDHGIGTSGEKRAEA
ncbi:MAG TPA: DNA alkylation repair protein [Firmicutes bacterium]|nr:DNA alkylation repair protein [Bacillota bacterium]